ncbi:hypothetical protein F4779DRAFT_456869 [Xylariaceae sp. FL0662B]|nr:hypothetical protein F4779DRAFT_456869 [Xylariaceae sp. FL0662B]
MAPPVPSLSKLMYQGFHSGFQWETQGTKVHDQETQVVTHSYRSLLHHTHSFHIARIISRGLDTTRKDVASQALARLYDHATDNIDLCKEMSPEEFFAYAKDSWDWSSKFRDEAFWAFTYKAIHARAIFLATVEVREGKKPHYRPLTHAIDRFTETFHDYYGPHYPNLGKNPNQEDIETVLDDNFEGSRVIARYFPFDLTDEKGEGDGGDQEFVRTLPAETAGTVKAFNPMDIDRGNAPNDEREDTNYTPGFYWDFGPKFRDRYQAKRDHDDGEEDEDKDKGRTSTMGVDNDVVIDDDDDDDTMMMDVDGGGDVPSMEGLNLRGV